MRESMITARLGNRSRVLVLTAAGACALATRSATGAQYDVLTLSLGEIAYGVDHETVVGMANDGGVERATSVGFDDLVVLARNYGATAPATSQLAQFDPSFRADAEQAFAQIPEPASASLTAVAAVALAMPSSHRRRQGGQCAGWRTHRTQLQA